MKTALSIAFYLFVTLTGIFLLTGIHRFVYPLIHGTPF